MVFRFTITAFAMMGLNAPAIAPIPKEIAVCSKWVRSNTKTPSTYSLKGYGGYGRVISAAQFRQHILGDHPAMIDPANGSACVFMASVSYDGQNLYGATVRETSTCTVLVRDGQSPEVAVTAKGDRAAWREFYNNSQKCSRPTVFAPDE